MLPRVSTAGVLVAVAVMAVGLAILRVDLINEPFYRHGHGLVVGVLPMACLLSWGLLIGIGKLIRRGESGSFFVGFQVFGWSYLLIFLTYDAATYKSGENPLDLVAPLLIRFFGREEIAYSDYNVLIFHAVLFFLPSFIFSVVGGWLSYAINLRLISGHGRVNAG